MTYEELKKLNKRAHRILDCELDWMEKYDMIFSDDMSGKVRFDYYDPDMDYEDDVRAWVDGFDAYMKIQKIIKEQIDNY
jgi:hypothetical protein